MKLRRLLSRIYGWSFHRCAVCGGHHREIKTPVISPALAEDWALSPRQVVEMDLREGARCRSCGCSRRVKQLAATITAEMSRLTSRDFRSLTDAVNDERSSALAVAEINAAGALHPFLSRMPHLRYSEYGSADPAVPSESLENLSYQSASMDLVITSDTLEHVPDFRRALGEILRILKPGAAHIFTVPILWDRDTRQRAKVEGDAIVHLASPSYHGDYDARLDDYIVFNEFGRDFVDEVKRLGFEVSVARDPSNSTLSVITARKPANGGAADHHR